MAQDFIKSHRMRDKIHEAATKVMQAQQEEGIRSLDVNNPWVKGSARDINVFDVYDGMQRLLLILEPLPIEKDKSPQFALHLVKWNCNPIEAHSLAVEAVYQTRLEEQSSIAQSIAQADRIPSDYSIGTNGSHEED